jgi:Fis family transcriptional regulator
VGKNNKSLQKSVRTVLQEYLSDLDGEQPCNLYEMVMLEIEKPLLNTVMQHCENNQSKAALCLGINRGTLRKKLRQHHLVE